MFYLAPTQEATCNGIRWLMVKRTECQRIINNRSSFFFCLPTTQRESPSHPMNIQQRPVDGRNSRCDSMARGVSRSRMASDKYLTTRNTVSQ